jgi:hypothetical protein
MASHRLALQESTFGIERLLHRVWRAFGAAADHSFRSITMKAVRMQRSAIPDWIGGTQSQ